ncbi:hypothetical protein E2562_007659 [Oryza meyeriana var. granulata]|uniref:Uncharacterized protein n=1 Tax=Oryza meyeriana var. granulata TaxID=110450 RepID=A0A6G1DWV2_9ORYZ|nr:hypothetical protein E2562_007659 [Oryza meyeriana var. granulata]
MAAMANISCFPATRGIPARGAIARSRKAALAAGGSRSRRRCAGLFLCRFSTTAGAEGSRRMEDYNTAMKRMMRNPYEYHLIHI